VTIGQPLIEGAQVVTTVMATSGDKITVFKYKSKVRYRRSRGIGRTRAV
jgi:ribosomal protein L21